MFDTYLNYGWKFWPITYVRAGCIAVLSIFNEKIAFMCIGPTKAISVLGFCIWKWQGREVK